MTEPTYRRSLINFVSDNSKYQLLQSSGLIPFKYKTNYGLITYFTSIRFYRTLQKLEKNLSGRNPPKEY